MHRKIVKGTGNYIGRCRFLIFMINMVSKYSNVTNALQSLLFDTLRISVKQFLIDGIAH